MFTQSCLAGNGRLDFTLTNVTGALAVYTVEVEGLAPRDVTLANGEIRKTSVTGRPDRVYAVEVRIGADIRWDDVATVDCDPDVELTIATSCLSGNGRIDVTIVNTTASPATYAVAFDTFTPRSTGSLSPGASSRQTITGRADGPFPVSVERDGTSISTTTETVACD